MKEKNNKYIYIIFSIILLILLIVGYFIYDFNKKDDVILTTTTTIKVESSTKTFNNANYGITLMVEDYDNMESAILNVNEVENNKKYENILSIYEINLLDNKSNIINVTNKNMFMNVTYPNKENYNFFNILLLDDNNEVMETIPSTYENGVITFKLNNLSKYAIQGIKDTETTTTKIKVNNNTTTTKTTTKRTTTKNNSTSDDSVTINPNKNNYLVRFDKNGGSCYYQNKYIVEGNTITYPGPCSRSGYTFVGWYLNGKEFNFNTPINSNVTLIAEYIKNPSSSSGSSGSYWGSGSSSGTKVNTVSTLVYSIAMDYYNVNSLTVNHKLSIKNAITEIEKLGIDSTDVTQLKIRSISYVEPIDSSSEAYIYLDKYKDTFLKGSPDNKTYELAHMGVVNKPTFEYDTDYKKTLYAVTNGFDVTWKVDGIKRSCTTPFNNSEKQNLCNFGIIYKVIWEYRYNN